MSSILKNTVKFPLEIPQGYYVVCMMQTQAAYLYKVRLTDDQDKDIINPMTRQSQNALPPVYADIASFRSNACYVVVEVSQSSNIDARIVCSDFNGIDNSLKVRNYTIVAEDNGDSDYNDLFLTITAYKSKG